MDAIRHQHAQVAVLRYSVQVLDNLHLRDQSCLNQVRGTATYGVYHSELHYSRELLAVLPGQFSVSRQRVDHQDERPNLDQSSGSSSTCTPGSSIGIPPPPLTARKAPREVRTRCPRTGDVLHQYAVTVEGWVCNMQARTVGMQHKQSCHLYGFPVVPCGYMFTINPMFIAGCIVHPQSHQAHSLFLVVFIGWPCRRSRHTLLHGTTTNCPLVGTVS